MLSDDNEKGNDAIMSNKIEWLRDLSPPSNDGLKDDCFIELYKRETIKIKQDLRGEI